MAPLPASLLSHSDLPAFQVVPPNKDVQVGDLKMPDGTPMVGPDGLLIPPARQFSMIVNSATRVYSYRWDEAMRDNFVAARAMRRDAFLRGLLEERILPTINREWVLEVDDDRDPEQQYVRDGLSRLIKGIPDFDAFKRALLDAVWFGRAGTQWAFGRDEEVDNLWGIPKWDPVHGDSCQFTFDGIPAILLDTTTTAWYADHGATFGPQGDLRQTDRAGTALVLQRPYWRDRFAIHRHMLEKADYLEGELAGSVQGLGLRGLVYWQYVVRSDALTWMLAYMQAVGQMDLLVFNFPAGNAQAEATQLANAQKIIGKAAIACPRDPKGSWPAVEQIQMNSAGLAALQKLVADYFDRHIERLIVGQSMSSGADKGTGLGGTGRAEFAKATKDEILVYDTNRLDQTLTLDLIRPLKKYNFPWAKFPVRFKSVMPDLNAQEKVMSGKVLISVGVPIKADEMRQAAGYSRPEPGDETIGAPMAPPGMGAPPGGAGSPPPGGPGGAPPSWMGAPAGGPPGAGGPALMSRGQNPARYAGQYYPGGGNTYIPKQDKGNPNIGFTRYADTNVTPLWAKDLVRLLDQMTATDLDGIKVLMNNQKRQVHIDVLDWGDPKVGKRIEAEAKKAVGAANVTVVNEGAKPAGPGWVSLYERSGATQYNLEEQKAFEQAIDTDPFEATNHLVFADWLDERGQAEEAAFRRYIGEWVGGLDDEDRYSIGPEDTSGIDPWRVHARELPHRGMAARLPQADRRGGNPPHIGRYYPAAQRRGYRTYRDLENAMRDAWRQMRKSGMIPNSRGQQPARYHHLPHEYCSTQVQLVGETQMRVADAAHAILETDLAGTGRELEPHVTVRWGLHDDDPQAVANLVGKFGPVRLRIGRADYFPDSGKGYDVIYYTVDSPDLTRLNRILGKVPNTQTHKGYKPHVTVAYVQPGKAREYVTRLQPLNLDVTVDGFEFRNRDGIPTWISTTGEYSRPVATDSRDNPNDVPSQYRRTPYGLFPFDEEREEPFLPPQDELVPGAPISTPEPLMVEERISRPEPLQLSPQASNETPPEAPPTVPPSPLSWDVDFTDPLKFADSLSAAFVGPPGSATTTHEPHVRALATALPPLVYERLAAGRLKSVVAHPTLESVTASWRALGEDQNRDPEGFYDPETGEVHHNGYDPVGVLAHEMAHAVDWSEPGSLNGYYQISSTPEWKRAWRVDLASGALNTYATLEPEEGFAEFARLVWAVPGGKEIAEREFPVAFKVFAGFGLI